MMTSCRPKRIFEMTDLTKQQTLKILKVNGIYTPLNFYPQRAIIATQEKKNIKLL